MPAEQRDVAIDLSEPSRGPRRRRRRRRHERDRDRARQHGPPRERLRPARSRAVAGPAAARRRRRARRPRRRATSRTRSTRSSISTAIPAANPEVVAGEPAGRPGAAAGRGAARARRDPPGHRGGGEPRQDHDVVDARAHPPRRGLAPELRDRRRGQRGRHQRRVRRRRVARRRGRRERRHVPRARARRRDRHERRARPPRPLRRASTRSCEAFEEFLARLDGSPGRRAPTTRSRRPARGARSATSSPTASPTAPTTASPTTRAGATAAASTLEHARRRSSGPSSSRSRAGTTRRTRPAATAIALELGVAVRGGRGARSRGFGGVARRFQFRGEVDGVTFVDDYAHLPGEVEAMIRAAREGGWPRVVVGVPAAPLHPDRPALARLRRRVRRRRRARAHRRVRGGGAAPTRGLGPAGPAGGARRPPRRCRWPTSRAGPSSWRTCPRCARPGDLVLTLGAGDLTTAPDEWLAPTRVSAATLPPSRRSVERAARRPPGRARGGGPVRRAHAPTASAARSALLVRVAVERRARGRSRRASAGTARRSSSSGGARTCSWPTPASRAWSSCSRASSTRSSVPLAGPETAVVRAGGAVARCPSWPAGPPPPGGPGSSSTSASPARSAARSG